MALAGGLVANCGNCRAENAAGRRFCAACGAALPRPCPGCGFANAAGDRFCGGCGQALTDAARPAQAAELRHATVLFVDLVGFTRQTAQAGPEALHDLLGRFFALADGAVVRWGGLVDKHLGDAVMAVFGAPRAHENDPERALRAVLEIARDIAALRYPDGSPLTMHAALATGRLLAGETGSAQHASYTVTGDAANLAARLNDRAAAGEILLDQRSAAALDSLALLEPLGSAALQGFAQPLEIFRLLGLRAEPAVSSPPMVGREGELSRLNGLLEEAASQRRGITVRLRGEAGIGKSRLLQALVAEARAAGEATLMVPIVDFGSGVMSAPTRRLAGGLLAAAPAEEEELLARLAPLQQAALHDLLERPQPDALRSLWQAQSAAQRREAGLAVLARLLGEVAASRPLLLAVEDLHWADAATLEALSRLRHAATELPVLLLLTTRAENDPFAPGGGLQHLRAGLVTLDLAPLSLAAAERLASGLAGEQSLLARAVERAGGNPLYLIQLLRHAEDGPLPDSLQGLIQARFDRLREPSRELLRAAAVLGQQVEGSALAALLPEEDAAALAEVERQSWLLRDAGGLRFSHALVRDAIYGGLTLARRTQLHGQAAAWYASRDAGLSAEHLAAAGDPAAPAAFRHAAEQTAARFQTLRALALAERGLALAAGDQAEALALLVAELRLQAGLAAKALAGFEGLAHSTRPEILAQALHGKAESLRLLDRTDEALAALEQAEPLFTELADHRALARLCHLRGNLQFPRGEVALCRAAHEAALAHATAIGDHESIARAHGGMGDALYAAGCYSDAHRHFELCIDQARAAGVEFVAVANLPMIAHTAFLIGWPISAVMASADAAIAAAEAIQQARPLIIALHARRNCLIELDRVEEAEAVLQRCDELALRVGVARFHAENLIFLAGIRRRAGRRAEALAFARQAIEIARKTGFGYMGTVALSELMLATEDPAEAAAAEAEALALLARGGLAHNDYFFHYALVEEGLMKDRADYLLRGAAAFRRMGAQEPRGWFGFYAELAELLATPRPHDLAKGRALLAEAQAQGYLWAARFLAFAAP